MTTGRVGAGAELADQHDLVAGGIIKQHGAGLAALEDLTADHVARAAVVQAVPEEISDDLEVSLERRLLAHQFDCFFRVGHPS